MDNRSLPPPPPPPPRPRRHPPPPPPPRNKSRDGFAHSKDQDINQFTADANPYSNCIIVVGNVVSVFINLYVVE